MQKFSPKKPLWYAKKPKKRTKEEQLLDFLKEFYLHKNRYPGSYEFTKYYKAPCTYQTILNKYGSLQAMYDHFNLPYKRLGRAAYNENKRNPDADLYSF